MTKRAQNNQLTGKYEPVIGLEVHCQLKTRTKLFCSCPQSFAQTPNSNVCPVCSGAPGVLPVLNKKAVDYAIKMALAVGAKINPESVFARRQYFYPDLPKGYQITQFDKPYCEGGGVRLAGGKYIPLTRIHLEEDAGKSVHSAEGTFVDLNRAGIPLIEIVSEPSISSPQEASEYLKKLRAIVRYLGICDGNLEEGSFRCDANVSLKPKGSKKLGARCEIKNLNSFRNIEKSLVYEIYRQADLLDAGQRVAVQTRLWDPALSRTKAMRDKEESEDYRYFPEPDLPRLFLEKERVSSIDASLPELPDAKGERFLKDYLINYEESQILTSDRDLASFFETLVAKRSESLPIPLIARWVCGEYLREMRADEAWTLKNLRVPGDKFLLLLECVAQQKISQRAGKKVFKLMVAEGGDPLDLIRREKLEQVSDKSIIKKACEEILHKSKAQVDEYLSGKEKVFAYFVGQVLRQTGGNFNPQSLNEVLKELLQEKKKQ